MKQQETFAVISSRRPRFASLPIFCAAAWVLAGCGSGGTPPVAVIPTPPVNGYFALDSEPANRPGGGQSTGYTFTINRTAKEFDQDDVSTFPINRGSFTSGGGFLDATLDPYNGAVVASPELGNWILETPGVFGFAYISAPNVPGLSKFAGDAQGQGDTSQSVIPFVSNSACPDISGTQTYQFLTVPGGQSAPWRYQTDTAYGSVQIATVQSGEIVNFAKLQQYLLPGAKTVANTPVTSNPGPTNISGSCGLTPAGHLISVTNTIPVAGSSATRQALAELNLSSGFLLEYNTSLSAGSGITGISNILGAGYGSVGLLEPASPVSESSLTGDSFQGFIYEVGGYTSTAAFSGSGSGSGACASLQAALKTLAQPPSANTIYGGEYMGNDPSANASSNCDVAIDLGAQDGTNNGLFPNATVFIGPTFPLNNPASSNNAASGNPYSFPAVVIAGQVKGQNAIFVLAQDTVVNRPIAIYLIHASAS